MSHHIYVVSQCTTFMWFLIYVILERNAFVFHLQDARGQQLQQRDYWYIHLIMTWNSILLSFPLRLRLKMSRKFWKIKNFLVLSWYVLYVYDIYVGRHLCVVCVLDVDAFKWKSSDSFGRWGDAKRRYRTRSAICALSSFTSIIGVWFYVCFTRILSFDILCVFSRMFLFWVCFTRGFSYVFHKIIIFYFHFFGVFTCILHLFSFYM